MTSQSNLKKEQDLEQSRRYLRSEFKLYYKTPYSRQEVLAQKQAHRSMEQNRGTLETKPRYTVN